MKKSTWQQRAEKAGLSQKELAEILEQHEVTTYRQLTGRSKRGVPKYVRLVIAAWELMTAKQRAAWVDKAQDARQK